MQQSMSYAPYSGPSQYQAPLPEKDMLYTILCELKRTCREYTTAAMEANCMEVRQMFTSLLDSTLQMQGMVYQQMSRQNMYGTSYVALRQEIEKQIRHHQQDEQKTNEFLNNTLNNQPFYPNYPSGNAGYGYSQQHQPYMM